MRLSDVHTANALRAYDEYFRLCVSQPHLASFESANAKGLDKDFWNTVDPSTSAYVWFVAYMLKVFDDLLNHDAASKWDHALIFQLEMHRETLSRLWSKHWSEVYTKKLAKLITKMGIS